MIETLRPNAAGAEENLGYVYGDGAGTHYTCVDEVTPDDSSTEVGTTWGDYTTWQRDLYNLADHSVGSGTINHITVHVRCKGTSPIDQTGLKIAIKSGITPDESSEISVATAYGNHSHQWATDPNTGEAWTWAAIDALQAGISLRGSTIGADSRTYCTQVYVEVDYTPVAVGRSFGYIMG